MCRAWGLRNRVKNFECRHESAGAEESLENMQGSEGTLPENSSCWQVFALD